MHMLACIPKTADLYPLGFPRFVEEQVSHILNYSVCVYACLTASLLHIATYVNIAIRATLW